MRCISFRSLMRRFENLEDGLTYYDRLNHEFMYFEYGSDYIDVSVSITHISTDIKESSYKPLVIIFDIKLNISDSYKIDVKLDKDIMRIYIDAIIRKVDYEFEFSLEENNEDSSKDFIERSTNTIKNKIKRLEYFLNYIINEENSRRKGESQ